MSKRQKNLLQAKLIKTVIPEIMTLFKKGVEGMSVSEKHGGEQFEVTALADG